MSDSSSGRRPSHQSNPALRLTTLRPRGPWAVPPPGQLLLQLAPELFVEPVAPFDPALSPEIFVGVPATANTQRAERQRRAELGDPDLPALGSVIEKYRLEALLGVGGFAAVFKAKHLMLRTQVAIKVPLPSLLRKKPELAEALCREARYAARISHPNVVRVLDITSTEEVTYLVMEYISGGPLSAAIGAVPLPLERLLGVGLDVAAGLGAGLEQGLIHRDVKPSNIILSDTGAAKLVDFGLAEHSAEARRSSEGPVLVGTPGYMAPEVITGQAPDLRSDLYSLGVTLFQVATGRLPFDNQDRKQCLERQCREEAPHPRAICPALPLRVAELISWMLRRDPRARPQSHAELLQAMRRELSRMGPPSSQRGTP